MKNEKKLIEDAVTKDIYRWWSCVVGMYEDKHKAASDLAEIVLKRVYRNRSKVSRADRQTMLKIKSLLNHMEYFIKPEHAKVVDGYHKLCRKMCSYGKV